MDSVFVVYDDYCDSPEIEASDIDCDSVTVSFDYGDHETRIIGVFSERFMADLCASQNHCHVVEVPFEGDPYGR